MEVLRDGVPFTGVELRTGRTIIGRGAGAHITLFDARISRRHLLVECHDTTVYVRSLSRFATLRNGVPLPNGELVAIEDGDVLQLGLFSLIVRLSSLPRADVTREMSFLEAAATVPVPPSGLIGESVAMREVYAQIRRVAASTLPVLISGASGTGKELTARAIHNASLRRAERFVPVNAASLTESLCDSVLFGHERGAFTGALDRTDGAFRHADGGTLFLDEIGELPTDTT